MKIELGCGNHPAPGYTHCDKIKHSPHVDLAFDLEQIPWPFEDASVDEILAIDVFEHLRPWVVDVRGWLDECWRILKLDGVLRMRLPQWTNHYSYRDPTHYRVFHKESFLYWCPDAPGTVWQDFGRYYWGAGYNRWWRLNSVMEEFHDLKFVMQKIVRVF
jgi:hypothetical protein